MTTEHVRAAPAPTLRDVVVRLTGYHDRAPGPARFTAMPATYVPVILDLGDGWWVGDARRPDRPLDRFGPFVAGLTRFPVTVEHPGRAHCLQVDLHPRAARRLLGVSMSELADRTVPLDDVLGTAARELVARIAETDGWAARFALVQRVLAARLAAVLAADPGAGLAGVAARCGYADQAHMSREVAELAGMTPTRLRAVAAEGAAVPVA